MYQSIGFLIDMTPIKNETGFLYWFISFFFFFLSTTSTVVRVFTIRIIIIKRVYSSRYTRMRARYSRSRLKNTSHLYTRSYTHRKQARLEFPNARFSTDTIVYTIRRCAYTSFCARRCRDDGKTITVYHICYRNNR